jgi:hypothetical protein
MRGYRLQTILGILVFTLMFSAVAEGQFVDVIVEVDNKWAFERNFGELLEDKKVISEHLIRGKLDRDRFDFLAQQSSVKIHANRKYSVLLDSSVPLTNAQDYWQRGLRGNGVKIAILDTGIADHPMLQGRVILARNFSGNGVLDRHGHGTHVAGIAAGSGVYNGVAPEALLINSKVLDDNGVGSTASLVEGINWAVDPDGNPNTDDGADVLSISIGAPFRTPDLLVNQALFDAINRGVVVVLAAGNCGLQGGFGCNGFVGVTVPGSYEEAITVGAVDDNLQWATFSSGQNFGTYIKPDVVAPGVDVTSSWLSGYATRSGTSMATPMVAGAAALLLEEDSSLNHYAVKGILEGNAVDLGVVGKDVNYGSGFVDLSELRLSNVVPTVNITIPVNTSYNNPELIESSVAGFNFIEIKDLTSSAVNNLYDKFAIYEKNQLPVYLQAIGFSNALDFANHLYWNFPLNDPAELEFINQDYNYIQHEDKIFWYNNDTIYLVWGLNTNISEFLDVYSSHTGNTVGEDFASNRQVLREIDREAFHVVSSRVQVAQSNKGILQAQWGGSTPAQAASYTFGTSNSETYRTQRADNWYVTSTSRQGPLTFAIRDIDNGDDLDIYVYDYQASDLLCYSDNTGNADDECEVDKPNTDNWGFYINIIPYTVGGLYAEGNLESSAPSCSAGWLNNYDCRSGNERFREYRNSDCSTEYRLYRDCDDQDTTTSWSNYCQSGDSWERRTVYDGYCQSSTDQCRVSSSVEERLDDTCASYEMCASSSGQCARRTCSDYSGTYGSCANQGNYQRDGDNVNECQDVSGVTGIDILCWKRSSSLGDGDFCDEATSAGSPCNHGEYDCDSDSECSGNLQCKGPIGGRLDGCCNANENWDENNYQCVAPCVLTSLQWDRISAVEGEVATVQGRGPSSCSGTGVSLEIRENDGGIFTELVDTFSINFDSNGDFDHQWTTVYMNDISGPPEYVAVANYLNRDDTSSNELTVSQLCTDADGDGYYSQASCTGDTDCNDGNSAINPGATEICDGVDNNCAGGVDEGFNLNSDVNNCGSCGNQCSVGQSCSSGSCQIVTQCGNNICEAGETVNNCANDCYVEHRLTLQSVSPSTAGENQEVTFTIRAESTGTVNEARNIEGAIVPEAWAGIVYPPSFMAQGVGNAPAICPGNHFYDYKVFDIDPGNTYQDVTFTVTAPNRSSVDDCDTNSPRRSAWDPNEDFRLIFGTYQTNQGGAYEDFSSVDYTVTASTCTLPDGTAGCQCPVISCPTGYICSSSACVVPQCSNNNDCSSGQTCQSNVCVTQQCSGLPDGSSAQCQCHSDTDCTIHDANTECDFGPGWHACVPISYPDQCNAINDLSCRDNSLYRCEDRSTHKDWEFVVGCSINELCDAQQGNCVAIGDYDMIIDEAPPGVIVNKQLGTILEVTVKVDGPLPSGMQLQYNSQNFDLVEGSACQSNTYQIGENKCYFEVTASIGGSHEIRFGDDAQRIKIIGQDPHITYVTNSKQLYRRYSNNNAVNLLFAKLYEEAESNHGVVIDLDTQFEYISDYTVEHPFDRSLDTYDERRNNPRLTNNNYSDTVARFLEDTNSFSSHIVVVGDDYVVPHRRDLYTIRSGEGLETTPFGFFSKRFSNNVYTDQHFVQRSSDYTLSDIDTIFRGEEFNRWADIKIILPTTVSSSMRSSIDNLKQQLLNNGLVENMNDFSEMQGAALDCNSFSRFSDFFLFDPIDIPILIGTPSTNPAFNCYPLYSGDQFDDVISVEPSVWNEGGAIIFNTDNTDVLNTFSNEIIPQGQYDQLNGKAYRIFRDSALTAGIVMIPVSFAASAVGGTVAATVWAIDIGVNVVIASDSCYLERHRLPSGKEWISCGIDAGTGAAPLGGAVAGKAFRSVSKSRQVANLFKISDDINLQGAATKFITSSDLAPEVLNKIPRGQYESFLRMLERHATGNTDFGSSFGKKLTDVLYKANLKRSLFTNNPELVDILGDVVARHEGEALDAIAKLAGKSSAVDALKIVRSSGKWNKAQLEKLNEFDDEVVLNVEILLRSRRNLFPSKALVASRHVSKGMQKIVDEGLNLQQVMLDIPNANEVQRLEFVEGLGGVFEASPPHADDLLDLRQIEGVQRSAMAARTGATGFLFEIRAARVLKDEGYDIAELSKIIEGTGGQTLGEIDVLIVNGNIWEVKSKYANVRSTDGIDWLDARDEFSRQTTVYQNYISSSSNPQASVTFIFNADVSTDVKNFLNTLDVNVMKIVGGRLMQG